MTATPEVGGPVVVGVDASFGTAHAVQWGAREAMRFGVPLRLVHASGAPGGEAAGESLLDVFAAMVGHAYPELGVERACRAGAAVDALLDESGGARRVVLGANGTAGYTAAALGSVTHRVAVRARCPVFVVPAAGGGHEGERDGHPVVAAIAADASGAAVACVAAEEAAAAGDQLLLVHVRTEDGEDGATALREAAARCRERYPSLAIATALPGGERVTALLGLAARARLLVLGCHHGAEPFDTRLGDLAAAVVPLATCPVALVGAGSVAGH